MPTITQITQQKRDPNRRNVYLDGSFAFGCNVTVVARFRLRDGMPLTADEVSQIQLGEVRQECFDSALRSIQTRLHSRAELARKLAKKEWGEPVIAAVLDDLTRLGYLDDAKFAAAKATSAAKHRHHGRGRALGELLRAGVGNDVAKKTLDAVYAETDQVAVATALAAKQSARLKKLDPAVARRRLTGMLVRRGFDFDTIRPVVEKVLGRDAEID